MSSRWTTPRPTGRPIRPSTWTASSVPCRLCWKIESEFGEGKVFRPYRDTRFSPDKSPYKTTIAAHNDVGYISLSSDALGVGTGLYMPSSDQLARYRAAVADEVRGEQLLDLVEGLRKKHIEVSSHEALKSAPRGYPKDHPRIDLLRLKGLTAWKEWPVGAWLATPSSKRRIVEFLRETAPLREWLDGNVGATTRLLTGYDPFQFHEWPLCRGGFGG